MVTPVYEYECKVHLDGKQDVEEFVKITGKFDFMIDILDPTRHYIIDAKSIMGIFSLDLRNDLIVGVNADVVDDVDRLFKELDKFIR